MHQIGQRSAAKQQNVLHLIADLIVEAVEGCYSNERGMGYSSQGSIPSKSYWGHKISPSVWPTNTNTDKHKTGKKKDKKEEGEEEANSPGICGSLGSQGSR